MEAKDAPAAKRNDISVVAEDKNWRSYIANELNCAERWHNDWGFLAAGAIEGEFFQPDTRTGNSQIQLMITSRITFLLPRLKIYLLFQLIL